MKFGWFQCFEGGFALESAAVMQEICERTMETWELWLEQEVQAALDDPAPSVPHEQVVDEWLRERAALLKHADTTASSFLLGKAGQFAQ